MYRLRPVPHTKKEKESYDPIDLDQFKWGRLARNRLTQLIQQGGDRVSLTRVDTDRYGRSVAEVRTSDGTLVQEVLARVWAGGCIHAISEKLS